MSPYRSADRLAMDTIENIMSAYPLGKVEYAARYTNGVSNSCFFVTTNSGNYVLKVYNKSRTKEEILFEVSLLHQLGKQSFPCPQPQMTMTKEFLWQYEGGYCSVFSYLPGRSLKQSEIIESVVAQVGVLYACFRKAVDGLTPIGQKLNADQEVPKIISNVQFSHDGPSKLELLGSALEESCQHIGNHIGSQEVVHGDFFYENVIFDNGNIVGVVDFDDAYLGSPLLDFALAAMEFSVQEGSEAFASSMLNAFVRSYLTILPELPGTSLEIVEGIRYQCCKFAVYLNELASTHIRHQDYHIYNPYMIRLDHLQCADIRSHLVMEIDRSLESARGTYDPGK